MEDDDLVHSRMMLEDPSRSGLGHPEHGAPGILPLEIVGDREPVNHVADSREENDAHPPALGRPQQCAQSLPLGGPEEVGGASSRCSAGPASWVPLRRTMKR